MIRLLLPGAVAAAALFVAAWPWTGLYDRRPTVRLLAALVSTSALIVVLQVGCGSVGALTPLPLAVLAALTPTVSLLAWGLVRRRRGEAVVRGAWLPRLARPTPAGVFLGLFTALVYAALAAIAHLVPPYGWDTLTYHLTAVFHAAQNGSLAIFPHPRMHFYFPQAGELHSLWYFLLSGGGSQAWRVVGAAHLPAALLAGVAVRAGAEGLGLERAKSLLVPATMLTPIVMVQPLTGYVDATFAAFVLASLAFAILAAVEGRFAHLALCALAGGLALGTKWSFLYYAGAVALVLAGRRAWRPLAGGRPGSTRRRIVVLLLLFVLGWGYWGARNQLRFGSPLYPVRVEVGPLTLADGPSPVAGDSDHREWFVDSAWGWLGYPFAESNRGEIRYSNASGFGAPFAASLVCLLPALALAVRRRRWPLLRALLAVPALLAIWLAISPWEEPRYVIAASGIALLALATVVESIAGGLPAGRRAAPAAGGGAALAVARSAVVAAVLFSGLGGLLAAAPELPEVVEAWRRGAWSPSDYYPMRFGAIGEAFEWLSEEGGPGTTVTYSRAHFLAPLFGWHGGNRVVYARDADDLPVGHRPVRSTYASWRRFLAAEEVRWIVVWLPWWGEPWGARPQERWIDEWPGEFRLAADFSGQVRVYEPLFSDAERAAAGRPRAAAEVAELRSADRWRLEARQGASARWWEEPGGGLVIGYELLTPDNDYLDLRADLADGDWSAHGSLVLEVEATPGDAWLFVWLKELDPGHACRFRIDLGELGGRRQRLRLPLDAPDWRTWRFDPSRLGEIHLVIDDATDGAALSGELRIFDLLLE